MTKIEQGESNRSNLLEPIAEPQPIYYKNKQKRQYDKVKRHKDVNGIHIFVPFLFFQKIEF